MAAATAGHVESVAVDEANRIVYMASIGEKLTPMEKDGDGAILVADLKGNGTMETRKMIKGGKLHAPKGRARLSPFCLLNAPSTCTIRSGQTGCFMFRRRI